MHYVISQCIFKLDEMAAYNMKYFSAEVEAHAYSESKRHAALAEFNFVLDGIHDEDFASRLHSALSKPSITSDVVIQVLWDICTRTPTPAVIAATQNPALINRLIDYAYLSSQPSSSAPSSMKARAIDLMACLQACEADGSHGDVATVAEFTDALLKLYSSLSLSFKYMLDGIDPDAM